MKKVLALVLAIMMALGLVAAVAEQPTYHFEIVSKGFQSTYWQALYKGALAEIDALNAEAGYEMITMHMDGPDSESDVAQQVQQFTNALNANPDGIGFAAVDQEAFMDLLAEAVEKKIPIVGFDSGVPGAPEGAIYANACTDNYYAGTVAAENLFAAIEGRIEAAEGTVRVGEVNQDATGESVTSRGRGFIDKFIELASAKGWGVAVTGNEYYVNNAQGAVAEADAKIIIEARVPSATQVNLCANEAAVILNEADTIAIFGSNQTAAEGIIAANNNLFVLGSGEGQIVGAGFDAGSAQKAAVAHGTLLGAITQSPLGMGKVTIDVLLAIARGEAYEELYDTGCAWYTAETMGDENIAPNLYD